MVHVVNVGAFITDGNHVRVDKGSISLKTNKTQLSHLVIPNNAVINSSGYPTVKSYLESEANDNFIIEMINETTIVTKKVLTKETASKTVYVLTRHSVNLRYGRAVAGAKAAFVAIAPFTALLYNDNHVIVCAKTAIVISMPSVSMRINNQQLLWNVSSDPFLWDELTDYIYWN